MAKTFLLSDDSLNSYGYRVLTDGIDMSDFEKNPVLLFNHERMSWGVDKYDGPIGRWDNVAVKSGKLYGDPVFDEEDPKGKMISNKIEKNFIRAASIGFQIIELSEDKKYMLPGQTRPTVTKCKLVEVSVVDVPANKNALALYDDNGHKVDLTDELNAVEKLNAFLPPINKDLKIENDMKLNVKNGWAALMAFLAITPEEGKDSVEHELTDAQLESMNTKLSELGTVTADRDQLKTELAEAKKDAAAAALALTTTTTTATELSDALAATLKAAKLDGDQKGKAGIDALGARISELGKLSGTFPLDNNENLGGEGGAVDDAETTELKATEDALRALQAEMAGNDEKK